VAVEKVASDGGAGAATRGGGKKGPQKQKALLERPPTGAFTSLRPTSTLEREGDYERSLEMDPQTTQGKKEWGGREAVEGRGRGRRGEGGGREGRKEGRGEGKKRSFGRYRYFGDQSKPPWMGEESGKF